MFLLVLVSAVLSTSYYLDKDVPSSGDGSSWSSAWKDFLDVDWSLFSGGDILYVSGGDTEKVYTTEFSIQNAFGEPDNPIVVTVGTTTGHDGTVMFDGELANSHGIYFSSSNEWVVIDGFSLENFLAGAVRIQDSRFITVQNCRMYVTGHGGVWAQRANNVTVRNNYMWTPTDTPSQVDTVYIQRSANLTVEDNILLIHNNVYDPHCDCLQCFYVHNVIFRRNFFVHSDNKESNSQGLFSSYSTGVYDVYDNIGYLPNSGNGALKIYEDTQTDQCRVIYRHNTLIGGHWRTVTVRDIPRTNIHNNILTDEWDRPTLLDIMGADIESPSNIDYNIVYAPSPGSSSFRTETDAYSWEEWKAAGFNVHGLWEDPRMVPYSVSSKHAFRMQNFQTDLISM